MIKKKSEITRCLHTNFSFNGVIIGYLYYEYYSNVTNENNEKKMAMIKERFAEARGFIS